MKKIVLFTFVLLLTNSFIHAQKKKDLLDEIDKLRVALKTAESELTDARKKDKMNKIQVESMQTQVNDLKETNASLLNNMTSFTELSNKKAVNLQKTQEIIKEKDKQLSFINDTFIKGDSLNLVVFSAFKNAIGGDYMKIANGIIHIVLPNTTLFGSDKNYIVNQGAKATLEKIAATLNANPTLNIIVEGNSNALKFDGKKILDNWDLSARQAASVVRVLQNEYQVAPKRMEVLGKGEYGSERIETSTRIIIDPEFGQFYSKVKDTMKNDKKG